MSTPLKIAIVSFFIVVEIFSDPFGLMLKFGFVINIMLRNIRTTLKVNESDKC